MAGKVKKPGRRKDKEAGGEENPLLGRYRAILVDRLTAEDLAVLQAALRDQFDGEGNLVPAYKAKFEEKLRTWLHEEVLRREIPGIEVLVRSLEPGDLKKEGPGRRG